MSMVKMDERVSIIMAAYNAEKTIRCAIDSVLLQTYTNFELLVIDDCSTDGTRGIIQEYCKRDKRVKLIINSSNLGVSQTRLNGLRASTGEWIAVLDSDDAWMPEKLEKQIQLQHKTNAVLLYTGSKFIDCDGNPVDWIMRVPEQIDYRGLLKQNIISNSSSLCRKDVFEKFYTIGDDCHEDFALWLKILKNGEIAYGVDQPLLIYRLSPSSKSGNKVKAAIMNWKTYRRIGLSIAETLYYQCCYVLRSLGKYIAIICLR